MRYFPKWKYVENKKGTELTTVVVNNNTLICVTSWYGNDAPNLRKRQRKTWLFAAGDGYGDFETRAALDARIQGQSAAEDAHALRDVAQSQAVIFGLRRVKAQTVVTDAQNDFAHITFELDAGAPRA